MEVPVRNTENGTSVKVPKFTESLERFRKLTNIDQKTIVIPLAEVTE